MATPGIDYAGHFRNSSGRAGNAGTNSAGSPEFRPFGADPIWSAKPHRFHENAHTPSIPSSDEIFAAHADERLYVGSPARDPDVRRQLLAVLGALALYLMFVAVLAIEARFPPVVIPAEDEIPVEIVVAPPPPPQPTPEPKQETPPPDTTPAYDAPKSGKSEKDDSAASDKDAKAAPAAPAMDASAERASGAEEDAKASTPEAPTVPNVAPPTPETPPAPVLEGDAPPPNPQQAMSARASPSKPAPAAGKPKPLFDSVPDVDFGGAAKMAPVSGGNGPSHYLNIVYGMIMQHLHRPGRARTRSADQRGGRLQPGFAGPARRALGRGAQQFSRSRPRCVRGDRRGFAVPASAVPGAFDPLHLQ